MSVCRVVLCCWERVFAMPSAFSGQNSISLCAAPFCPPMERWKVVYPAGFSNVSPCWCTYRFHVWWVSHVEGQLRNRSDGIQNVLLAQSVIKVQMPYLLFILKYRSVARHGGACANVWVSVSGRDVGQPPGTVTAGSLALCPQLRGGAGVQAEMAGRLWASPPQLLCAVGEAGRLAAENPNSSFSRVAGSPLSHFCNEAHGGERGSQPGLRGSVSRGRSPRPWLGGCMSCSSCLCRSARPHFLKLVYSSWLIYHCFPKN